MFYSSLFLTSSNHTRVTFLAGSKDKMKVDVGEIHSQIVLDIVILYSKYYYVIFAGSKDKMKVDVGDPFSKVLDIVT